MKHMLSFKPPIMIHIKVFWR